MTPNEYQQQAARTLIDAPDFEISGDDLSLIWRTLDLVAEQGELAEHIKKGIFHQHGLRYGIVLESLRRLTLKIQDFSQWVPALLTHLDSRKIMLLWNVIGLVGEAGEVARLILAACQGQALAREKLIKELGDCLWYLTAICTKLDLPLEEVMEANIEKLKARYPDGFSAEASRNRQG